jgi:hypothetical protein
LSDLEFVTKCKELEIQFNRGIEDSEMDKLVAELDIYIAAATDSQLKAKAVRDCSEIFNFEQEISLNSIQREVSRLWEERSEIREKLEIQTPDENFVEFDFEQLAMQVKEEARQLFFSEKYKREGGKDFAYRA